MPYFLCGMNSTLLKKTTPSVLKAFNCRIPEDCPMAGNCLISSVVYQATVTTEDNRPAQTYVGLTENSFKARFANHKSSFNNPDKRLSTELSKHVWCLKEARLKIQGHPENFETNLSFQSYFAKFLKNHLSFRAKKENS